MAKNKKLTKKELESIQGRVNGINQLQMQIGGLEVQKNAAVSQIKELQNELNVVQGELEKKYGRVSVNINDGTIKAEENGSIDKKNQYRQRLQK